MITLAIVNARIWTGDVRRPWADALAVEDGRIAIIGSSAEIRKRIPAATRVIDAHSAMVVSGVWSTPADVSAPASGVLTTGAPADLTMFDRDLTQRSAEAFRDAQIVLTIVAGAVAFEALDDA